MTNNRLLISDQTAATPAFTPAHKPLLQRRCACGGTPGPTGECARCRRQRKLGQTTPLQPKLTINQPGDRYEQEADRIAERVMRMPEPQLQRQAEPEEEEEMLQSIKEILWPCEDEQKDHSTRQKTGLSFRPSAASGGISPVEFISTGEIPRLRSG